MRFCYRFSLMLIAICLVVGSVAAQTPEVTVGDLDFPNRVWGTQTMSFEVTNNTEMLKFMTVETDVAFPDSYANPQRHKSQHFILPPATTKTFTPELEIPGCYGQGDVWVRIIDVVDTLDDVSIGHQAFEQKFSLRFNRPATVEPYYQERITLPPLMNKSQDLDSEFSRLLLIMLNEGKSLEEIAQITGTTLESVQNVALTLAEAHYIRDYDGVYRVVPPVILLAEAEESRKLAVRISDQLVELIGRNDARYDAVIDSLVAAGALDPNDMGFMSGKGVLLDKYPVYTGLYLWQVLGQRFINNNLAVQIFQNSNPCRPNIGTYMYIAQGGDFFNGHHYYDLTERRNSMEFSFGDQIPIITCQPGWENKQKLSPKADWTIEEEYRPESIVYDSVIVHPALRALDTGAEAILDAARDELREIHIKHGHQQFSAGVRYWFWNLTATLTVDKLVKAGTITKKGNGQYRFIRKNR